MAFHRSIAALALLAGVCDSARALAADDIRTWTEAVPGSSAPFLVAEGVVDAAPAAVWAIVANCADYVKNLPSIVASKELSREGDEHSKATTVCEVVFDAPFPFSDLTSVSRATLTADEKSGRYSREWTLIRGDYEVNEGSWQLVPVDGGAKTKVTYRIHAKPKLPVPDSLIARTQMSTLPQVIERLRERTAQPR